MSMFGDYLRDNIWIECKNARMDGKTTKDVLLALAEVMQAVIEYSEWLTKEEHHER